LLCRALLFSLLRALLFQLEGTATEQASGLTWPRTGSTDSTNGELGSARTLRHFGCAG
jgi:hypothetical protein